jgi:hypothetical protein
VRFKCPDGDSASSIHKLDELRNGREVSIYFEDDHLDALVSKLKQKGIIFISEPEDKTWLWREAHLEHLYSKEIAQSLTLGLVIDWNLENVPHTIIAK